MNQSSTANWLFKAIVLVAIATLFFLHFSQHPPRLAYVETSRLLDDYQGMVEARRAYQSQRNEWQRNIDTLQHDLERNATAYQQNQSSLKPTERQEAETRLRIQQQQFVEYRQAVQEQDQKAQVQHTQQVLDSTNAFLKRFGERSGYDMILLTAQGDNIAFAKKDFNVTVPVLKELNGEYIKKHRK